MEYSFGWLTCPIVKSRKRRGKRSQPVLPKSLPPVTPRREGRANVSTSNESPGRGCGALGDSAPSNFFPTRRSCRCSYTPLAPAPSSTCTSAADAEGTACRVEVLIVPPAELLADAELERSSGHRHERALRTSAATSRELRYESRTK